MGWLAQGSTRLPAPLSSAGACYKGLKNVPRHDLRPAVQPGPKVHEDLPHGLRRASVETDPGILQKALSDLAPAGLQSTNLPSIQKTSPDEQTAPAQDRDYGSPRRRTGPGILPRADDKERSLAACLDGAWVRGSEGSWAGVPYFIVAEGAEVGQGNKNAQNENK